MDGIEFPDTDAFLDEIPQAYKPIDQVMADDADPVSVRHTLLQLVNVKGDEWPGRRDKWRGGRCAADGAPRFNYGRS